MLHNLLIYRLAIVQIVGVALVAWSWSAGWVEQAVEADRSRIVFVIAAVFLLATASLFRRAFKVARALNAMKDGIVGPRDHPDKMLEKAGHLDDVPEILTVLGLTGTLVGIIFALHGITADDFASIQGVQQIAGQMLAGMGVAFYTSLVGMVFAVWATINRRILRTATVSLIADGAR